MDILLKSSQGSAEIVVNMIEIVGQYDVLV